MNNYWDVFDEYIYIYRYIAKIKFIVQYKIKIKKKKTFKSLRHIVYARQRVLWNIEYYK